MTFRAAVLLSLLFASSLFGQTPETKQVEVYGQKIVYDEAGSGAPVILLHGMGVNKSAWRATMPALAAHFHVYAIDQLGFGASDKPLINYRVETLVDFLNEFMRKLGIEKASIVGNSLGAWTAAAFAIEHPARVDKLVLADSAGYTHRPVKREDIAFLNPSTLAETRAMLDRVLINKQLLTDAFVEYVFAERVRAGDSYTIDRFIDSAVRGEDMLNGRLKAISDPVLVIWGREDPLLPVSDADAIASEITGAKKVILDKCGHVPQLECPVPFNKALIEFLSQ